MFFTNTCDTIHPIRPFLKAVPTWRGHALSQLELQPVVTILELQLLQLQLQQLVAAHEQTSLVHQTEPVSHQGGIISQLAGAAAAAA